MKPRPNIGSESERRAELSRCMSLLAGGYGKVFDDNALEAYWHVLGELPAERMRRAFDKALAEWEGAFPPPPGVIRQKARTLDEVAKRDPVQSKPAEKPPEYTAEQRADMERSLRALRRKCHAMETDLRR